MKVFHVVAILLSAVLGTTACSGSLSTGLRSAPILLTEDPSLELSVARLAEIEAAVELSDFFLTKAPVGPAVTWPDQLHQIDRAYARRLVEDAHCGGPYALPTRVVLALAIYDHRFKEVRPLAVGGEFPSFEAALKAIGGPDADVILSKAAEWRERVVKLGDTRKAIADLNGVDDDPATTGEDREKNLVKVAELKADLPGLQKDADTRLEGLLPLLRILGGQHDLVGNDETRALARNLYVIVRSVALLQEHAEISIDVTRQQYEKALPATQAEMVAVLNRWSGEGMPGVPAAQTKLLDNIRTLPGRLAFAATRLEQERKLNLGLAEALARLSGYVLEEPDFEPLKSEFVEKPKTCGVGVAVPPIPAAPTSTPAPATAPAPATPAPAAPAPAPAMPVTTPAATPATPQN